MKNIFFLSFLFYSALGFGQNVMIPDPNLLQALIDENVDISNDNIIQVTEAKNTFKLDLYNKNITDLEGLQYFTNLIELDCSKNEITEIDLSNYLQLSTLICYQNDLTSIDLSNLPLLEKLECQSNPITDINVTSNSNLSYLSCSSTEISSIDISQNSLLDFLSLSNNEIDQIDVNSNPLLTILLVRNCNLENINVSNNTLLSRLDCSFNKLNTINIENNINLKTLSCSNNVINDIDVSQNTILEKIFSNDTFISNIDVSNNPNLTLLSAMDNNLEEINLTNNLALKTLILNRNNITEIDLSLNSLLEDVSVAQNPISNVDFKNNVELEDLRISDCYLSELDVSQNKKLELLNIRNTLIEIIDLSANSMLSDFYGEGAPLHYLNIHNGSSLDFINLGNNSNPLIICLDEEEIDYIESVVDPDKTILLTNCILEIADITYDITGRFQFSNTAFCTSDTEFLDEFHFTINNGENFIYNPIHVQESYLLSLPEGNYNIIPLLENNELFNFSPDSLQVNLNSLNSPITQDFCVWPKEPSQVDIKISIIPLNQARPGFEANYKIIYENQGNINSSGTIELQYPSNMSTYVSSSANLMDDGDMLSLHYTDLKPFESREILLTMKLNSPMDTPPLVGGTLCYVADISPSELEYFEPDNHFKLVQDVVNSYDPNDKTCLQGSTLLDEMIGNYIDYMIRFENTGTGEAVNISILDKIDTSTFDISTIRVTDFSHPVYMQTENNLVRFIFQDIYLPYQEGSNTGYVTFKLKTKNHLSVGDSLQNTADIYFDFNYPIRTNTTLTNIVTDMDGDGYNNLVDCDDDNYDINPGQIESPYNFIDDDCNIFTLDDDLDQDGFLYIDDCNDNDANVNPNSLEIPYNGIDEDCNPETLDDDLDQDGYNMEEDCDDTDFAINPDAEEIPNNDVDENCDGLDIITATVKLKRTKITISPNPSSSFININNEGIYSKFEISIYNTSGTLIINEIIQNRIDLTTINEGIYFIKIQNINTQNTVTKKIVIIR